MKIRKLNARGVAHHFLLALIVVGVAAGGTYYVVASKANTIDGNGRIHTTNYSVKPDGTDKQSKFLPLSTGYYYTGVVSPDGTTRAYVDGDQLSSEASTIKTVDVNSEAESDIKTVATLPAEYFSNQPVKWSPDGKRLLIDIFSKDNTRETPDQALVVTIATGEVTRIPHSSVGWLSQVYNWKNNDQMLYVSNEYIEAEEITKDSICTLRISDLTRECTEAQFLASKSITKLVVSNDEKTIYFASYLPTIDGRPLTSMLYALNENVLREISKIGDSGHISSSLALSPDNTQLVFSDGDKLMTIGVDGSNMKTIIEGPQSHVRTVSWTQATATDNSNVVASCSINNLPSSLAPRNYTPTITVTNLSRGTIDPTMRFAFVTANGGSENQQTVSVGSLAPNQTTEVSLPQPTSISKEGYALVSRGNVNKDSSAYFECKVGYTIEPARYAATCSVSGVPLNAKPGTVFEPIITITNAGNTPVNINASLQRNTKPNLLSSDFTLSSGFDAVYVQVPQLAYNDTYVGSFGKVTLNKVINQSGQLLLSAKIKVELIDQNCTVIPPTNVSVPPVKTYSYPNANLQGRVSVKVVTDKGRNDVLLLGTASKIGSTRTATFGQQFNQFVGANTGKQVSACVTARADADAYMVVEITAGGKTLTKKTVRPTRSYSDKCFNFTIPKGELKTIAPIISIRSEVTYIRDKPVLHPSYVAGVKLTAL